MSREKKKSVSGVMIDDMVVNLLSSCYNFDYADISGHFYQLALQASQTEPNIIGPLKPPTGLMLTNKLTGKSFAVTKKVDVPKEVPMSVWCVRGFYPGTGIPFKMTMWQSHEEFRDLGRIHCKITMGNFGDKNKWTHVNVEEISKYIEEIAERTLLSQPIEDVKKPEYYRGEHVYKCMSPKGLPLQKKDKKTK
jgi:hypothetical protein